MFYFFLKYKIRSIQNLFIQRFELEIPARERALAHVSRAVHD